MSETLNRYLARTLAAAEAAGRRRSRRLVEPLVSEAGRIIVDGRPCTAFCSNDYLGLASDARLVEALALAARQYGVGSGASHLVSGHSPEHEALEQALAEFVGREKSIVFSTGYMANLGIACALLGRGDLVVEDRLNHASLIDAGLASGARFARYAHADPDAAEAKLMHYRSRHRVLLTDGVFSMDGDQAPLAALADVCRRRDAWLVVDDAHGFGVLGATGRGTSEACGIAAEDLPVLMATLGKSLGVFGAFVAGPAALIDVLVQRARTYLYTTALPPALARAARTALEIVQAEPWRRSHLASLVRRFRSRAAALGLPLLPSETPIQPIVLGSERCALAASTHLLETGFLVPAIRPPTVPAGASRLRVTLSAIHQVEDVDRLLDALAEWLALWSAASR